MAQEVFKALERTIPRGHQLYPLLNRHTVKVSYSTMPNLEKKISNHNRKIIEEADKEKASQQQKREKLQQQLQQQLQQPQQQLQQQPQQKQKEKECNCRNGVQGCPLRGKCLKEKNVVYVGKVLRLDNFEEKRYTGVHEGPFKTRYYGHAGNIRNKNQKGTRLSRHVWELKSNQPHPIPFEIEWDILGREKPYNPVTGVCRLCLLEAFILMFDNVNTTLNSRFEYWSSCPHRRKYLLSNS